MTRISRIVEYQGRTYELSTDEELRHAPVCSYAHLYRIRKDGTRGRQITTGSIIYSVLHASDEVELRA